MDNVIVNGIARKRSQSVRSFCYSLPFHWCGLGAATARPARLPSGCTVSIGAVLSAFSRPVTFTLLFHCCHFVNVDCFLAIVLAWTPLIKMSQTEKHLLLLNHIKKHLKSLKTYCQITHIAGKIHKFLVYGEHLSNCCSPNRTVWWKIAQHAVLIVARLEPSS